jgi:hypothetical protein
LSDKTPTKPDTDTTHYSAHATFKWDFHGLNRRFKASLRGFSLPKNTLA